MFVYLCLSFRFHYSSQQLKSACQLWWNLAEKSKAEKIFEGERSSITLSTTLPQIFCKIILDSKVTIKSIIDPDDNWLTYRGSVHITVYSHALYPESTASVHHATCYLTTISNQDLVKTLKYTKELYANMSSSLTL